MLLLLFGAKAARTTRRQVAWTWTTTNDSQIYALALQVLCVAATAGPALCMLQALILSARRSACRHDKNSRAVTTRALAKWAGPVSPVSHKQQADRAGRPWRSAADTITGFHQGFAASAFEAEQASTRADEDEPSELDGDVDFRYRLRINKLLYIEGLYTPLCYPVTWSVLCRIPLEDVWPASKSQRKSELQLPGSRLVPSPHAVTIYVYAVAGRVHRGLEAAVQRLSASGDHIIQSLGFCVEQV